MAKDPTPRADQLREQREARYGHLQATAEPARMGRPVTAPTKRKLIPFAGKESGKSIAPKEPTGTSGKPKPGRARIKHKRRTELPPEGTTR